MKHNKFSIKRLDRAMERKEVGLGWLAERLNMSHEGVRKLAKAGSTSFPTLLAISNLLDTTVNYLQEKSEQIERHGPSHEEMELASVIGGLKPKGRRLISQLVRYVSDVEGTSDEQSVENLTGYGLKAAESKAPYLAEVIPLIQFEQREALVEIGLLGAVAAGQPWPNSDEYGDVLPVPRRYQKCVALEVRGDSMIDVDLVEGDILLVEPACLNYRKGQIVVACVDGGMVVKTYGGQGSAASPRLPAGHIRLLSENESVPPLEGQAVDGDGAGIEIRALVVGVIKN
jgi:SOS-response transcriptional repressor LexA